jgi:hypothetical protein
MRMLCCLAVAVAAGLTALDAQTVCAQGRSPGPYEPQLRPTLSPWLKLYSRQSGPVDNYHSFVRPELQLQDTFRRQDLLNEQQSAGMSDLKTQVTELQTGGKVRPTGAGAEFMRYSHYYDMRPPRPRPPKK